MTTPQQDDTGPTDHDASSTEPPVEEPTTGAPNAPATRTGDLESAVHPPARDRPRRRRRLIGAAVAVAVVAAIPIGMSTAGDDTPPAPRPYSSLVEAVTARAADLEPRFTVTAGGPARTWSDFTNAGGRPGPQVVTGSSIKVICRTDGFVVPDGNRWWYLIASQPWNKQYWITADAFYNRPGVKSGSLKNTPFFDERVPVCP